MSDAPKQHERLSDRILRALELSIEQGDLPISEMLRQALDMSLTRNTGGQEFTEKREYPEEIETCMEILNSMRSSKTDGTY